MAGWFESIPIIGTLFKDTTDIIKEVVVDKDAQNKILESLDTLRMQVDKEIYIKELDTKTIPSIDALHKMGRQLLNFVTIIAVVVLSLCHVTITPEMALIMGGGNVVYQWVKGKGNSE